jgi:pimeloyl-ACP methyl ester carboxylesterase
MPAPTFTMGPRVSTTDGVEIATYDLGGEGPPLVLCHGTGFHGLVWLPVAAVLSDRYHCVSFDARGHGRSGKAPGGVYAWDGFARDVLAVVDGLGLEQPRGVGHSCGGAMLLLAEEARPGTFTALYCYEPVVSPRLSDARSPGPNSMAQRTRRRREVFPTRDAALANYQGKPPFTSFDPDALRAYVEHGFEDLPDGGVRLRCRREDEARVYEMSGHHGAFERLDEVGCPVALVCGAVLPHFGPDDLEALVRRLPSATAEVLADAGHFGPMERPAEVASATVRAFEQNGTPRAGGPIPVTPSRYPGCR